MDTAHWPQEFCSVKGMEELVPSAGSHSIAGGGGGGGIEQPRRAGRPPKEQAALQCPRCSSTNTKFCYYNNYSLTQPRYFCKSCRRYWTEGGSLRNVPVGGGSRKNRRSTSSTPTSAATTSGTISSTQKPRLSLAFPMLPEPGPSAEISAMELLGRGLSPFVPMHPMPVPMTTSTMPPEYSTSGFVAVHQDYRPNGLNFPLDGIGGGYGSVQEANGRLLFPFEDSRQVVTSNTTSSNDRGQGGDAPGFWSGMIGGGGGGGGGAGGGSW